MRFHVLGVGSIGTLISYHIRRSIRLSQQQNAGSSFNNPGAQDLHHTLPREVAAGLPPRPVDTSITLHLRKKYVADKFRGLHVEHAGIRSSETGYRLEATTTDQMSSQQEQHESPPIDDAPSLVQQAGYTEANDAIDSLIVTTKANATVQAMEPLCRRLTPASTIVLLQNGMGTVDELIHTFFPDAALRPQIILGNVTHGCYSKRQFEAIHAGYGSIHLGLLPDPRGRATYERRRSITSARSATADPDAQPSDSGATYRNNLSGLDFNAIPREAAYLTLRYTLATLLSLPLDVHWEPLELYQVGALRKLVVNSCINPLTAILDCKNGQLIGDPFAQRIWSEVCHEAAEVFLAAAQAPSSNGPGAAPSPRRSPDYTPEAFRGAVQPAVSPWAQVIHRPLSSSDDDPSLPPAAPLLHASLTPASLYSAVRGVAVKTRSNYSSMHSDVRGTPTSAPRHIRYGRGWKRPRGTTEIEYMNGYLVQLGQAFGVDVPTNILLRNLVLSLGWGYKKILSHRRKSAEEELDEAREHLRKKRARYEKEER